MLICRFILCALVFLSGFAVHAKPVQIVFWHSMAGQLGETLNAVSARFNEAYPQYQVQPVYKGDYTESLTSFSAAFRAKQAPSLIQVYEVGTAMMLASPGVIKPLADIMVEQGISLPYQDFLPAVSAAYSDKGRLMAMPFNLSIPVIFYNADMLKKLGVKQFPKTWAALEILADKLVKSGYSCAYTSAYPAWILLESYAAINGIDTLNSSASHLYLKHLARLKAWQDKQYFNYGGRTDEAMMLFTSEHCALLSQSSGSYRALSQLTPFNLGVALMPYDTNLTHKRQANVVGGAALWAVSGQSTEVYHGIALFFAYLARTETQDDWHRQTGYLPIGLSGQYASILDTGQKDMLELAMQDWHHQVIFIAHHLPQNRLRGISEQALTALFAGLKSPELAIHDAKISANHVIARFLQNTK